MKTKSGLKSLNSLRCTGGTDTGQSALWCAIMEERSITKGRNESCGRKSWMFPKKQFERRRLWLNDGSCVRLRPEYRNHGRSYDFIENKLTNSWKARWLNIIDESVWPTYPGSNGGIQRSLWFCRRLWWLRGCPVYMRSDNGSEFTAH